MDSGSNHVAKCGGQRERNQVVVAASRARDPALPTHTTDTSLKDPDNDEGVQVLAKEPVMSTPCFQTLKKPQYGPYSLLRLTGCWASSPLLSQLGPDNPTFHGLFLHVERRLAL